MSKNNKNYSGFYKPTSEDAKEVSATEETVETPEEEAPVEEPKVEETRPRYAVVTGAKKVNLREKPFVPTSGTNVITVLKEHTKLMVVPPKEGESNIFGWVKVRTLNANKVEGYMMSNYIKEF